MINRSALELEIIEGIKNLPAKYLPDVKNYLKSILILKTCNTPEVSLKSKGTGFLNCWQDEKTADEIIEMIENARKSNYDREIEL